MQDYSCYFNCTVCCGLKPKDNCFDYTFDLSFVRQIIQSDTDTENVNDLKMTRHVVQLGVWFHASGSAGDTAALSLSQLPSWHQATSKTSPRQVTALNFNGRRTLLILGIFNMKVLFLLERIIRHWRDGLTLQMQELSGSVGLVRTQGQVLSPLTVKHTPSTTVILLCKHGTQQGVYSHLVLLSTVVYY